MLVEVSIFLVGQIMCSALIRRNTAAFIDTYSMGKLLYLLVFVDCEPLPNVYTGQKLKWKQLGLQHVKSTQVVLLNTSAKTTKLQSVRIAW
jgi:hypothetical protein